MENENTLDFNFWTAFADMMLALVLVLSLLVFLVTAVISLGSVNLKQVESNQRTMIDSIAQKFNTTPDILPDGDFGISTTNNNIHDIRIQNDLNSQQITFSDKLLFRPDDTAINPSGQVVLDTVGETIKGQIDLIKEIQIQGHADTQKTGRFRNNTELAANRAIAVFEYLQEKVGIDPNVTLMSATSFGEFRSVQRSENADQATNREKIIADNADENMRSRNRRIEIVLIYRR